MEVVSLLNNINFEFGNILYSTWLGKFLYTFHLETNQTFYFVISTILAVIFTLSYFAVRRWQLKALTSGQQSSNGTVGPRFRKRDKALFYGRKMLRKVKSISGQVRNGQGKKRKMMMRFARRLLKLKPDTAPMQLKVLEPPNEYLEEECKSDDRMPPDALYMLQSIRVFGHFEKPVFLKLIKNTEILNLPAGAYLFKIGETDENMYVVQSGKINVFITGQDGSNLSLKIVKTGESVTSLLSFTDVLTGHPNPYKTVSAKAIEDSQVVRLPMSAFQEVFNEYPDIFIRVMQVIMVRLQRVTFTALHQYLGLSAELVNQGRKKVSPYASSPIRSRTRESFTAREDIYQTQTSYQQDDTLVDISPGNEQQTQATPSQPIPITSHRRSKSALEMKNSASPASYNTNAGSYTTNTTAGSYTTNTTASGSYNTPDMVPDFETQNGSGPNIAPDIHSSLQKKRHSTIEYIDEQTLLQIATEAFVRELKLDNDSLIQGKIQIREVPAGTYLMKEESNKIMKKKPSTSFRPNWGCFSTSHKQDIALVYVISGTLIVSQRTTDANEEVHMYSAHHGEMVGGLAVLTGEPSSFTIRAKNFTRIAMLSKNTFYGIMREKPQVVLQIAHMVIRRLSPFVRQVDFALDWIFLESGRALYRQEDESDSTYIVLSGRLRSVITHSNGKKELVGEYGKGDLVGIVEMVTQTKRSTTVMAVRDSELAKLPEGLFNAIKLRFPIVVTRLINLLGHRILGTWQKPNISSIKLASTSAVDSRPSQLNFSTVAIVTVSDDVPITAFTYELYHSLCAIGPTLRLTSDVVRKTLGASITDPNNEYRLTSWLAQQEDQHRIALYQCDLTFSPWTQRCIRQADCIIIVGLGENAPSLGKVEKEIGRLGMRTQKELVLLHKEGSEKPNNTVAWLNMRSWVSHHHHIQCPNRMFSRKSQYRINELYSKVLMSEPNVHSDFSRLARWLTGTSVGLVLGGGGARGAAHIGMIKSIQESGIPIDMVGGVSIGAFMGALWCSEKNITTVTQKAREWSKKMTQWWRQIFDLTYPVTSMFSGRDFNQTIRSTFGDTYIEDLWLPYFTVTTDITDSCMRIHTHGSLWRYVRASMSLSGYMPPLCDPVDGHLLLDGGYVNNVPGQMWRYIRASMSFVGIFPPVCDPVDGHLLVDGCYVNNVPADVMRSLGAHHIIAIDVGSVDDTELTNYGDDLSGWWLLWKRWNPFTTNVKVPNLPDIQSRLAYVSCVRQLEEVKNSDYCEYIRPPIDRYRTLQFGSFDEIREVGYAHGKAYFEGQLKAGVLPIFKTHNPVPCVQQQHILSGYTFTDLAQMVCKVSRNSYLDDSSSTSSDEEYEDGNEVGYASEPSAGILDSKNMAMHHRRAGGSLSLSENELEGFELEAEKSAEVL